MAHPRSLKAPKNSLWISRTMHVLGIPDSNAGSCYGYFFTALPLVFEHRRQDFNDSIAIIYNKFYLPFIAPLYSQAKMDCWTTKDYGQDRSKPFELATAEDEAKLTSEQQEKLNLDTLNRVKIYASKIPPLDKFQELQVSEFFNSIQVHQDPRATNFFDNQTPIHQDSSRTYQLFQFKEEVLPLTPVKIGIFSGSCEEAELTSIFEAFGKYIDKKSKHGVAWVLNTETHTTGMVFGIEIQNHALLIEFNLGTLDDIPVSMGAKTLMSIPEFTQNTTAVFNGEIHVAAEEAPIIQKLFEEFKKTVSWQKFQEVTQEKIIRPDSNGNTWFNAVAEEGNTDLMQQMLRFPIPKEIIDKALYTAIRFGKLDILKILCLNFNIDLNGVIGKYGRLFYNAILSGHPQIVDWFLQHPNVKINFLNSTGDTMLSVAASKGFAAIVKMLSPLIDPNKVSKKGMTALLHAEQNGHAEVVKILSHYAKENPAVAGNPQSWFGKEDARQSLAEIKESDINNKGIKRKPE